MHDVPLPRLDRRAERLPHQVLEVGVGEPGQRRAHGPSEPRELAQPFVELGHRPGDRFGIDRREVHPFAPAPLQEGLAVSHLGHDVGVERLRQAMKRLAVKPAHQRHAEPVGVAGLGQHQGPELLHRLRRSGRDPTDAGIEEQGGHALAGLAVAERILPGARASEHGGHRRFELPRAGQIAQHVRADVHRLRAARCWRGW